MKIKEFRKLMSEDLGISQVQVQKFINSFTKTLGTAMTNGDKVSINSFATFHTATQSARKVTIPKTKIVMETKPKDVVRIKLSTKFRDNANVIK